MYVTGNGRQCKMIPGICFICYVFVVAAAAVGLSLEKWSWKFWFRGPILHGNLVRWDIFPWNNGPGGPNFHGEIAQSWKNGPPLENCFPVICIIYKDPNYVCVRAQNYSMSVTHRSYTQQNLINAVMTSKCTNNDKKST